MSSLAKILQKQDMKFYEWARTGDGRVGLREAMRQLLLFDECFTSDETADIEHTVACVAYSLPHQYREEGTVCLMMMLVSCHKVIDEIIKYGMMPEQPDWGAMKELLKDWCEKMPRVVGPRDLNPMDLEEFELYDSSMTL